MSNESPRTPENNTVEKDEIPLDDTSALTLQLAQSRMNEAQLALQLRQREAEALVNAVKTRYEEGGRYVVTMIKLDKLVIERYAKLTKSAETDVP